MVKWRGWSGSHGKRTLCQAVVVETRSLDCVKAEGAYF